MATINQMINTGSLYSSGYNSVNTDNSLSTYYSIKNGSYKKLLKSYYAKNVANSDSSTSTSKDKTGTTAAIQSSSSAVKEAAQKLTARGSKSLFNKVELTSKDENGNETKTMGYDTDKIYKAVKDFADEYNSLLDNSTKSNNNSVLKSTLSMVRTTKNNTKLLQSVGISVGSDNKLSIDEKKFKEADMNAIKTLFNGTSSYADNVASKAGKVLSAVNYDALKSNTYTLAGAYSYNFNSGDIYTSFF